MSGVCQEGHEVEEIPSSARKGRVLKVMGTGAAVVPIAMVLERRTAPWKSWPAEPDAHHPSDDRRGGRATRRVVATSTARIGARRDGLEEGSRHRFGSDSSMSCKMARADPKDPIRESVMKALILLLVAPVRQRDWRVVHPARSARPRAQRSLALRAGGRVRTVGRHDHQRSAAALPLTELIWNPGRSFSRPTRRCGHARRQWS